MLAKWYERKLAHLRNADLLLKVVDISHPEYQDQMRTTEKLLDEMGLRGTPAVWVFNKIDKADSDRLGHLQSLYPEAVSVSGIQGRGLDRLCETMTACYEKKLKSFMVDLNYGEFDLLNKIRKLAVVVGSQYSEAGMTLQLKTPSNMEKKLQDLLNKNRL